MANAHLDTPEEAAIAQRMLEELPEDPLARIAADIMSAYSKGIEQEFAIGRLLAEAAALLNPSGSGRTVEGVNPGAAFGKWFAAQGFPFTMKTGWRLRIGAEREAEVRQFIALKPGRDIGVNTAVSRLMEMQKKAQPKLAPPSEDRINPWLGWYEEARDAVAELEKRLDEGWPLRDDFDDLEDWLVIADGIDSMVETLSILKRRALGNGPAR